MLNFNSSFTLTEGNGFMEVCAGCNPHLLSYVVDRQASVLLTAVVIADVLAHVKGQVRVEGGNS